MVATANTMLNIRVGLPSTDAPKNGYLVPGNTIEVAETIKGSTIEGNDVWYKGTDGSFYWSGGFLPPVYPYWMKALKIPDIWATYNEYGANAKVAVLDSGYNINNQDIQNGVIEKAVFIPDVDINDVLGHGSHCASIIGGRNKLYPVGCAPLSQLYIGKITQKGSLKYQALADAITWAISKEVDIISISYGGPSGDPDIAALINTAVTRHNIIVIASIGDNVPANGQAGGYYPALLTDCIAVGAVNSINKLSPVTMVNAKTEINAPGENIMAYSLIDTPEPKTGTSQSTAIVAGICALIVSRYKAQNKTYTPASIKKLLQDNSDHVADSSQQLLLSPAKIFSNI